MIVTYSTVLYLYFSVGLLKRFKTPKMLAEMGVIGRLWISRFQYRPTGMRS